MREYGLVLEIVLQVLGNGHREEANELVELRFTQLVKLLQQVGKFERVPWSKRTGVGWCSEQKAANQAAPAHHVRVEPDSSVCIPRAVTHQFTATNVRVLIAAEEIAVLFEGHARNQRNDLQPMSAQVQGVIDLGTKQAADIGTIRILPAVMKFTTDRRTTDIVILLDNEHSKTRFREESGIGQAVMACPDNDGIVVAQTGFRFFVLLPESPMLAHVQAVIHALGILSVFQPCWLPRL